MVSPDRAKPRLDRVGAEGETGKTTGTKPLELGLMRPFPKWDYVPYWKVARPAWVHAMSFLAAERFRAARAGRYRGK